MEAQQARVVVKMAQLTLLGSSNILTKLPDTLLALPFEQSPNFRLQQPLQAPTKAVHGGRAMHEQPVHPATLDIS